MTDQGAAIQTKNRYDRMEFAGAFGDLGTLIPFVLAYIGVLKMEPFGLLLAFGVSMIVCGFVYCTPMPVQPMKAPGALATTQAAQTLVITPAIVWGATLVTGLVWLLLGLTGTARYVATLITRPVVLGIVLGLGFGFIIDGAKMMAQNWWVGGAALLGTALLLSNRVVPAMFLLLVCGAGYGICENLPLLSAVQQIKPEFRMPAIALSGLTLNDFLLRTVFLALPQIPLTLGNAVIAITKDNNRLFPVSSPGRPSPARSPTTALRSAWTAKAPGATTCRLAAMAKRQIRRGAPAGLRQRRRGPHIDRPLARLRQPRIRTPICLCC